MIRCCVSSMMNPQQEVPDRKTILAYYLRPVFALARTSGVWYNAGVGGLFA